MVLANTFKIGATIPTQYTFKKLSNGDNRLMVQRDLQNPTKDIR